MTNEAFGCAYDVVETEAEACLVDYLVRIFAVDVVFDGLCAGLVEVLGRDLDQIRDCDLGAVRLILSYGEVCCSHD